MNFKNIMQPYLGITHMHILKTALPSLQSNSQKVLSSNHRWKSTEHFFRGANLLETM